MSYEVNQEAEMINLGHEIAAELEKPAIVYLQGDLGVGKSVLARAIINALGFTGAVKSPTYTLVENYVAGVWRIAHLDLYRLNDPEELHFIGFRDIVGQNDLLLIEWPEKGDGHLPLPTHVIKIAYAGTGRTVAVEIF